MRFRLSPSRRRLDKVTINLASMIDVSFLLLFYFMVATMMRDRETRLSTTLQAESSDAAPAPGDFQPQFIDVRSLEGAPAYQLGAVMCRTREELASVLKSLPKEPGLFVRVFDDVDVAFAVAAIQTARDAGFTQVTYVPAN